MKIKELLEEWEKNAGEQRAVHKYQIRLPISVAAHIRALAQIFPGRSENEIIVDLLSTALDELVEALPYIEGSKMISEDEFGEPVYEDVGLTPKFIELSNQYARKMEDELGESV